MKRTVLALVLAGCSSPVTVAEAPQDSAAVDAAAADTTVDTDVADVGRVDTESPVDADTSATDSEPDSAPVDTGTAIDSGATDTGADTSTGDGCVPTAKTVACAPPLGSTAWWCGKVDDGCGGKVACDPCALPAICVNGPGPGFGDRGVCACMSTTTGACKTTSGAAGVIHQCSSSAVAMDPACAKWKVMAGSTEWCCPG